MKKFALMIAALLVGVSAHAQKYGRSTSIHSNSDYSTGAHDNAATGYFGFGQGAINIGADFETSMASANNTGLGGYFLFMSDKKDDGATIRAQVISFGADVKVHYKPASLWDIYAAPGFGIALVDNNTDQNTTFGPSIRFGALYQVTPTIAVGLEHANLFNWFSSKIHAENVETMNVAGRINF